MKTRDPILSIILGIGLVLIGIGCEPPAKTGSLQINLTDAPGNYSKVVICFTEISVHLNQADNETEDNETEEMERSADNASGWIVISDEEQSFDLLTLQMSEGKFAPLADAELPTGKYTQIRLKITDGTDNESQPKTYLMLADDNETRHPLIVPSGTKSGLKLTGFGDFRVSEDNDTVIYLDFDAEESVHKAGSKYMLQPTIKVLTEEEFNQG